MWRVQRGKKVGTKINVLKISAHPRCSDKGPGQEELGHHGGHEEGHDQQEDRTESCQSTPRGWNTLRHGRGTNLSKLFGFDGNAHLSLVDNNYNRYLTYLYLRVSSHSALSLSLKQVLCCFLMFDHLLLQSFSKISLALKITNLVDVVDYFRCTYACPKDFLHITKH